jgi:hypothetical protein
MEPFVVGGSGRSRRRRCATPLRGVRPPAPNLPLWATTVGGQVSPDSCETLAEPRVPPADESTNQRPMVYATWWMTGRNEGEGTSFRAAITDALALAVPVPLRVRRRDPILVVTAQLDPRAFGGEPKSPGNAGATYREARETAGVPGGRGFTRWVRCRYLRGGREAAPAAGRTMQRDLLPAVAGEWGEIAGLMNGPRWDIIR